MTDAPRITRPNNAERLEADRLLLPAARALNNRDALDPARAEALAYYGTPSIDWRMRPPRWAWGADV